MSRRPLTDPLADSSAVSVPDLLLLSNQGLDLDKTN